jgi:hypothetical protein
VRFECVTSSWTTKTNARNKDSVDTGSETASYRVLSLKSNAYCVRSICYPPPSPFPQKLLFTSNGAQMHGFALTTKCSTDFYIRSELTTVSLSRRKEAGTLAFSGKALFFIREIVCLFVCLLQLLCRQKVATEQLLETAWVCVYKTLPHLNLYF